jgi:dTMP kinase
VEDVWRVGAIAVDGIEPDLTFLLDMNPQEAARRLGRAPDRMESQGLDFLRRVRQGYLEEARRRPASVLVINAARDIDSVQSVIRAAASSALAKRGER